MKVADYQDWNKILERSFPCLPGRIYVKDDNQSLFEFAAIMKLPRAPSSKRSDRHGDRAADHPRGAEVRLSAHLAYMRLITAGTL